MAKRKLKDDPGTPVDESLMDDPTDTSEADAAAQAAAEEAAKRVAAAKEAHAQAVADLKDAEDELATAQESAAPKAVKGTHIYVDMGGHGSYAVVEAPDGYDADAPDRQLLLGGANVEHVATIDGIWAYRRM